MSNRKKAEAASAAVRKQAAVAAIERIIEAFVDAEEHIQVDLQPEFQRLADGKKLTWPKVWSSRYDQSVAAQRLATWWHGVQSEDVVAAARDALIELSGEA